MIPLLMADSEEEFKRLLMKAKSSLAQPCLILCDSMDCSTPQPALHHKLPDFTQTHVH